MTVGCGSRLRVGLAVMLLGLPLAAPAWANDVAEAKKHFARGVELVDEGRVEQALVEFQRAYELKPHYSVLYNIGSAHVELGRPVEAVEALEKYLRDGGNQIDRGRRTQVEAELKKQRARIASIDIQVSIPSAVIRVDNVEVGRSPLRAPIRVALGSHSVSVSADGYGAEQRSIVLAGEEAAVVRVDLKPVVPPLPPAPASLRVTCSLSQVKVMVDGKFIGITPIQGDMQMSAGKRLVRFDKEGVPSTERWVDLMDGRSTTVNCDMALPAMPKPVQPADTSSGQRTWGYALGIGGLALGATALGIYLWNDSRYGDWEKDRAALDLEYKLRPPSSPDLVSRQSDADNLLRSIQTVDKVTIGIAITGGAALATGLVLVLTSGGEPKEQNVTLSIAPGHAYLGGRF